MDKQDNIPGKTRSRALNSVKKVGYMDGASDGQTSTFQSSFDTGYKQGFNFGLELGLKEAAYKIHQRQIPTDITLTDTRRINCQICQNGVSAQENIVNLYNIQKEKNDEYIESINY